MSAREFALLVGVASTTITRAMLPDAPEPTVEFLAKLARATNTDLCTLVKLVVPDLPGNVSADALLLAERISRLPKDKQEIVDAFILGTMLQKPDQKS